MIFGIGHDIVDHTRIKHMLDKYGDKFINRILTNQEQDIYHTRKDNINFLAKRFAAKEAFAKACGTGLISPINLLNISVLNDNLGKPILHLEHSINEWLKQHHIINNFISISDEKQYSSAFVILETSPSDSSIKT